MTSKLLTKWNNLSKLINFQQMLTRVKLEESLAEMMCDVSTSRVFLIEQWEFVVLVEYLVSIPYNKFLWENTTPSI